MVRFGEDAFAPQLVCDKVARVLGAGVDDTADGSRLGRSVREGDRRRSLLGVEDEGGEVLDSGLVVFQRGRSVSHLCVCRVYAVSCWGTRLGGEKRKDEPHSTNFSG